MNSTKRARDETIDLLHQLFQSDPTRLALAATDAQVFAELADFSERLCNAVETIEKDRQEKQEAAQEAAQDLCSVAQQDEAEKERDRLVDGNLCFGCKQSVDILSACAGFSEDGISGEGVLLCENCRIKNATGKSCPECHHFLCKNDECCDPSYKCKSCGGVTCLPCAEKDEHKGATCCCDNWYCVLCVKNNVIQEECCSCSEANTTCNRCSSYSRFEKCEGDCKKPLCDACICSLACGRSARLCGKCGFKCADCDTCEGRSGSRWK